MKVSPNFCRGPQTSSQISAAGTAPRVNQTPAITPATVRTTISAAGTALRISQTPAMVIRTTMPAVRIAPRLSKILSQNLNQGLPTVPRPRLPQQPQVVPVTPQTPILVPTPSGNAAREVPFEKFLNEDHINAFLDRINYGETLTLCRQEPITNRSRSVTFSMPPIRTKYGYFAPDQLYSLLSTHAVSANVVYSELGAF
ncbi:MAG: hypothetical protein LBS22_04100 [Puniceicoccales bacterium]|jgi:hypothetical protein|nr:hypothetical protein [Puniceicoccales bacterium]